MQLAGKVAIVTGSSRGIGKDIALAFAAEGSDIVVAARSETAPDPRLPGTIYETAQAVESLGRRALAVKTDVTNEEDVAAMVNRTLETFGRIDILVNNAGVLVPRGILELPTRHLDLHYRVNLKGPILCMRAVLPTMLKQGQGWIINISSVAAKFPGPGPYSGVPPTRAFMYAATKAALERLSQALAVEYHAQGISVNVLSPAGRVRTPGNVFGMTPAGGTPEPFEKAEAMEKAAVFIASQLPRSYTGHIVFDQELIDQHHL